ncbi:ArsR/SmtB family transcription factor [Streptomyces sp. RPT161]|uniref:ArsR/SmtB family transcription factor n=1 Tax=Streptomyces sp. RPT161 TaxID=3015993 RepID=UPI0022B90309|nr:metalloregulator ArsR/SmtB family transcription factor [Streptomyces sp. RPT161]
MTAAGGRGEDPPTQALEMAAAAFAMLSSAVRLHIVWALTQRECGVSELTRRVGCTPQAVSQHLAKLKLAGIVRVRREGRNHVYALSDRSIDAMAVLMIERFSPHPAAEPAGPPWTAPLVKSLGRRTG